MVKSRVLPRCNEDPDYKTVYLNNKAELVGIEQKSSISLDIFSSYIEFWLIDGNRIRMVGGFDTRTKILKTVGVKIVPSDLKRLKIIFLYLDKHYGLDFWTAIKLIKQNEKWISGYSNLYNQLYSIDAQHYTYLIDQNGEARAYHY